MGKIIPKGWLSLKPFNDTVDVFLPFKVPLRDEHQLQFSEEDKFTWIRFRKALEGKGLKLVAVIDLIPHTQHYVVEEMVGVMGLIPYYKIGCKGGHVLPSESLFTKFYQTVQHILDNRPLSTWRDNEFIGVHCAKGVNRTGFMICKYLITSKQYNATKAIEMFSQKRQCSFEREKYVTHLMAINSESEQPHPNQNSPQVQVNTDTKTTTTTTTTDTNDLNSSLNLDHQHTITNTTNDRDSSGDKDTSEDRCITGCKKRCDSFESDSSKEEDQTVKKTPPLEHSE